jgi:16S rRNA (guanine(1405)-N(7))-methyltransferase
MVSIQEVVAAVKRRRGLETLSDDFVQQRVDRVIASNAFIARKMQASASFEQFSRSREYEELLKRVRKMLRAVYGVFQDGNSGREQLLSALRAAEDEELKNSIVAHMLQTHTSTKERLPYYDEIYGQICSRIHPKNVIDLGCGMNPLAYRYFVQHGCEPQMIASDISKDDMDYLAECFKILGIPGKTVQLDLTEDFAKLQDLRGDVTFLFKVLDSLEESQRHVSYRLFDAIQTQWIVTSFPTRSLGGRKRIARAGRAWFERLLARKGLLYDTFSVENELFYICRREPRA